jgi:hypothetical protein
MFRASKFALTISVLLAAGSLISACGEDRSHLLPGENVREISANLDTVQELVDAGDCFAALKATDAVQDQAEALPQSVDPKLKRALIDGVVTLTIQVGKECQDDPNAGTTDEPEVVEPELETTTGATGPTDETEGPTGTTGKKNQKTEKPSQPKKPNKTPSEPKNPNPEPTPPVTPNPPTETPPTDTGPGSGGISPNP